MSRHLGGGEKTSHAKQYELVNRGGMGSGRDKIVTGTFLQLPLEIVAVLCLERLVFLFWILGLLGFSWIAPIYVTDPNRGYLTSVIRQKLV